jgi:serine/threonine protein kinase
MALTVGTQLGSHEITALLGKGGMGEVYRARDTKLKREVAIKILPEEFSRDADRVSRFQREAEVLASLNHPNIAAIHDLEETNGTRYLVLELVEGETLADRIACRPIPADEALDIAKQIAEALEAAHERGIIHRDLKPANVKLTLEGKVKVLDFGLAKAMEAAPTNAMASNSPTLLSGTMGGMLIGTAAYMSPEQAAGKPVDKRADIWSFGVVLWEMLAGEQLFKGETVSHILASVLKDKPDLSRAPLRARRLLGRCLEKDPRKRLRDIGDVRLLLDDSTAPPAPVLAPTHTWLVLSRLGWVSAVALAFAFGLLVWWHFREEPPHVVQLFLPPPEKAVFPPDLPTMSVSPDGQRIAFETRRGSRRELWVRELGNLTPQMLAAFETNIPELPIWAPDSRQLVFFDGAKLKKISLDGGPAQTIAETVSVAPGSGSWNRDNVIIFGKLNSPLFRVPASAGGAPEPLTQLDKSRGEIAHWAPWFLPDGRHFLYLAQSADPEKSAVYVGDLSSKSHKQVLPLGTRAIYVNPGYLLYVRDRTLMAQPFDVGKLETTGDAVPLGDALDRSVTGAALGHFSASQNGVLAYTAGGAEGDNQLTWFDRSGKKLGAVGTPGYVREHSLSPDDSAVVFARRDPQGGRFDLGDSQPGRFDLWVHDLVHDSESPLTSAGASQYPVYSADGTHIFFEGKRDGDYKVYRKASNGTGSEELVSAKHMWPMDASRDYLFTTPPPEGKTRGDIWVLPFSGDRKPFAFITAPDFTETRPRISPGDGRWLAYQSNESNGPRVYVVSFPKPGGKWPISTAGGTSPAWSRDGRELYYYSPKDNNIMAVEISPGKQFQFGVPKPLFAVHLATDTPRIEVSRDGRFLLPALVEQQDAAMLMTVVLNWPEMLKKK